jgi:hypothetical protein
VLEAAHYVFGGQFVAANYSGHIPFLIISARRSEGCYRPAVAERDAQGANPPRHRDTPLFELKLELKQPQMAVCFFV